MDNLKPLVIGTRGSDLALWQAEAVRDALRKQTNRAVEVKVIETRGDKQLDLSLSNHKLDKGLFTRELEQELHSGEVDFAVHSLKDMPVDQPEGLALAAVLPRGDVRDVIVARPELEIRSIRDLAGLKIGTGSPRRSCQLRYLLESEAPVIADIRGNVPTRTQKVLVGEYDATILAYAGLERLQLLDKISLILPIGVMLPAPGQGAVGIQCSLANTTAMQLAQQINDSRTMKETYIERAILRGLGGGCALPLGIYCDGEDPRIFQVRVAYARDEDAGVFHRQYMIPARYEPDTLEAICYDLAHN